MSTGGGDGSTNPWNVVPEGHGLGLPLHGPGLSAVKRIPGDNEEQFEVTKRYFNKKFQEWLATRHSSDKPLLIEMEIERLGQRHDKR